MALLHSLHLLALILSSTSFASTAIEIAHIAALKPALPRDPKIAAPILSRFVTHYAKFARPCHFLQHLGLLITLTAIAVLEKFGFWIGLAITLQFAHVALAYYAVPLSESITRMEGFDKRPTAILERMEELLEVRLVGLVVCGTPCLMACLVVFVT